MFIDDKRRGGGGDGPRHYLLDGHKAVPCTLEEWCEWLKNGGKRRVAFTPVHLVHVSTVFLGLDHRWGSGPPLIFETMIFGGAATESQWRCSTWNQAEEQHRMGCAVARGAKRKPSAAAHYRKCRRELRETLDEFKRRASDSAASA